MHTQFRRGLASLFLLISPFFFTALSTEAADAQTRYFTKSGSIEFVSKTALENIDAINKKATCVLDARSGAIEVALLMKAFEFEKALMQEHFNENYVESDKFPKSLLKGKVTNIGTVNFHTDGTYPITLQGQLTMHGVTHDVTMQGQIAVKSGKVSGTTAFPVLLSDYNIDIPSVVKDKVSKTVNIIVTLSLEPLP